MKKLFTLISIHVVSITGLWAQTPTLASFSPISGTIGSSVTITGTNFNATASQDIVFFGATQAMVTGASATTLTVTVPIGATFQYISVTNLAVNLTAYSAQPFIVTLAGSIAFATKVDSTAGANPYQVSMGDIDGDGKPDLAIANQGSSTVSVLRNTSTSGIASFAAKVNFTTGANPFSVSIGDIDGDGKLDLVLANNGSSTVSVFRNTSTIGTISFAAKVNFTTTSFPNLVNIGDIDGDGKPDLAVAETNSASVSVFRNTSTIGTVSFATKVDFATASTPYSVSIGDIDGDGKPDLAVTNEGSNTVSVLRNTSTFGTIIFAAKVDFITGAQPWLGSIGDIDGDGKPDLAVANSGSNTLSVLRNTSTSGTVSFAIKVDFTTGDYPNSVSIGDIDGDGKPDLAITNATVNTVSVFRNTSISGAVSFATKQDFTTGSGPISVRIGDIDGDGKPDLSVANNYGNSVSVLRQFCTMTPASITPASATTFCQGDNVVLNANTGTNLSYQWKLNGTNISGSTSASYTANTSGNYSVRVDTIGCSTLSTTTVVVNSLPPASITQGGNSGFCPGGNVILNANTGTGLTYHWQLNGNTITGAIAAFDTINTIGNYKVIVSNAAGCYDTSSATTVAAYTSPLATITPSGSTSLCQGNSVILAASIANGYSWNTGATIQNIPVSTSGNYSVTITDSNGCSATSSAITITVNTVDTAVSVSNATLTAHATGAIYQWINCIGNTLIIGATNQNYIATANGSYAVIVAQNGCSDTSACFNITTTGIAKNNIADAIKIYPNPTDRNFTIDISEMLKQVQHDGFIKITDELGKVVKTESFTGKQLLIEKGEMKAGIYFLQMQTEQGIVSKKLIIN